MYKGSYPEKIEIKRHEISLIFQLLFLVNFLNKLYKYFVFLSAFLQEKSMGSLQAHCWMFV
jgi:hypothetical protein